MMFTYTFFFPVAFVADQDLACTVVGMLLNILVPISDVCTRELV